MEEKSQKSLSDLMSHSESRFQTAIFILLKAPLD